MVNDKEIGMIVASDLDGIIGYDGGIPWQNKTDMARFRTKTSGATIIMGRRTFESIGRPLPKRENFIVSKTMKPVDGLKCFGTVREAVEASTMPHVWLIGGAGIYQSGIDSGLVDVIDYTILNLRSQPGHGEAEFLRSSKLTLMPIIPLTYKVMEETQNDVDPTLFHRVYRKR